MIRTITAVAVSCDHGDGDTRCDAALHMRFGDRTPTEIRTAAAKRGWTTGSGDRSGDRCPKHHPTLTAAASAETGA